MKELLQKIKNIVKMAFVLSVQENDAHQECVTESFGVESTSAVYSPYGLYSKATKNSIAVLLQCGARRSSSLAFVWNPKKRKKLEDGEVAIWNIEEETGVHLKSSGEIEIKGKGVSITMLTDGSIEIAGNIAVDGDLSIAGNIAVDGAIKATGTIESEVDVIADGISLKNHTHEAGSLVAGATAVTGTTGGAI